MPSEGQNQSASGSGASNHIAVLSLCLITACLQNIATLPQAPDWEHGGHILLWFNLVVGYLLAMASVFSTSAETKAAAAKLCVSSAWFSVVLVMIGELRCRPP